MPDKFDTYREALIVETETEWSDAFDHIDEKTKLKLAEALHKDAESAAHMEYIRTHTGFCRKIVVTVDDIQRVQNS